MSSLIADLINDPKVPKYIRYGIATMVCAFVVAMGIVCTVNSPVRWGKRFGVLLSVVFLIIGIYLDVKIYKSSK